MGNDRLKKKDKIIRVSEKVTIRLDEMKSHKRQSYSEVIDILLNLKDVIQRKNQENNNY